MRCAMLSDSPIQPLSLPRCRHLSTLSYEVQNAPRVSKEHTERALQYMEFKARAEQTLLAEMDQVKSVRPLRTSLFSPAVAELARSRSLSGS